MLTPFVITLREGLEAALVLAIVLSFLVKTGAGSQKKFVWYGAAAAAGLCLSGGVLLFSLAESLAEEAGEFFEISVTLVAVLVLTFMILWMKRQGRNVRAELEDRTRKAAVAKGSSSAALALGLLAFAAVSREGLETVLFLLGSSPEAGTASTVIGGLAGLAVAAILGAVFYQGAYRLNLKKFFDVTGVTLIVLAAGLIAGTFQEIAGEAGFLPALTAPLWDTGSWLSQKEGAGALLHSLLGYQDAPSLLALLAYFSYLGTMFGIYLRGAAGRLQPSTQEA